MAGRTPAGRPRSHLRHRWTRWAGSRDPGQGGTALVAVGADLSARHGARGPGGTAVSRALRVAESPLSSRVIRDRGVGGGQTRTTAGPATGIGFAAPPPVVRA